MLGLLDFISSRVAYVAGLLVRVLIFDFSVLFLHKRRRVATYLDDVHCIPEVTWQ